MLDKIQDIFKFLLSLKQYNIDIFAILIVNGSLQILKLFKFKFKSKMKNYCFWLLSNIILSILYSFIFCLPKITLLGFIKTSILTFFIAAALYEIIKSIKPLRILKEYIYNKFKKDNNSEKNI